jgi:hypothetical protein
MSDREYYEVPVSELGTMYGRKRRGCFFYGCLTVFIMMIIGVTAISLVTFFGARQLTKLVAANAEAAPAVLPAVEPATEEELKAFDEKLKAFDEALESDDAKDLAPLELTETQINQFIQKEPELKGVVYLDLEPDKITGKVSLPLDPFAQFFLFRQLRGKYLNGEGDFTAEITEQGLLVVRLTGLRLANGKQLPAAAMAQIGRENLAKDFNSNPDVVKVIRKLDRLEIIKDKVRLVPLGFALKKAMEGKGGDTPKKAGTDRPMPSEADFDKAVDEFRKEAVKP